MVEVDYRNRPTLEGAIMDHILPGISVEKGS